MPSLLKFRQTSTVFLLNTVVFRAFSIKIHRFLRMELSILKPSFLKAINPIFVLNTRTLWRNPYLDFQKKRRKKK